MSTGHGDASMLVVGATGFIGRKLVDALHSRKIPTCVLIRDASRVGDLWPINDILGRRGDVTNLASLKEACAGIHTVFHLASHAEDTRNDKGEGMHRKITVEGTKNLLSAAISSGVKKFIYVSSVKAMGEGAESCLDESSPVTPVSAYGRAKLEAEKLILESGKKHGIQVCILRLPLVYGRDNRGNIWRMMAAVDRGRFPPLPETGNKRSMVHVDDVIQALWLSANHVSAVGNTYIVTDGRVYSTRQILVAIYQVLGREAPRWSLPFGLFHFAAKLGDIIGALRGRNFVFDSSALSKLAGSAYYSCAKIQSDLGYQPTRFLEDGLREMADVYTKKAKQ